MKLIRSNPLFFRFLVANGISQLGSNIFDVAIPLYIASKYQNVYALSLIFVAINLPYFLMAPLTGYIVDNYHKRKLLVVADIGQAIAMTFLFIIAGYHFKSFEYPAILMTVFVAKSFFILSETATTFQIIPSLVPSRELATANSYFLAMQRIVQILGPVSSGLLLSRYGIRICILVNILSFSASLYFSISSKDLSVHLIHYYGKLSSEKKHPLLMLPDFIASLKFIFNTPVFKPLVMMMFLWNFCTILPSTPTTTLLFTRGFGLSAETYGLILSLWGVVSFTGFLFGINAYKEKGLSHSLIRASKWQAIFSTAALFTKNYSMFLIGWVFFQSLTRLAGAVLSIGTLLIRQKLVPKNLSGSVNSSLRMFFMLATPLSAFIQGFIINHFGMTYSIALGVLSLWGVHYFCRVIGKNFNILDVETAEAA